MTDPFSKTYISIIRMLETKFFIDCYVYTFKKILVYEVN